jgi:hypothetical protein
METETCWCGSSASRGEDAFGNKRQRCGNEKMMRGQKGAGWVVHGTVRRVGVRGHVSHATNEGLTGVVWGGTGSRSSQLKSG